MKIVICDDSMRDREILIGLLREYEKSKGLEFIVAEYDSGEALLEDSAVLQESQILFMDINLDQMSGLDVAAQIKSQYPPIRIVLVTAYMSYALDGYKVKASRFLVKDDLSRSIWECMDALVEEIRQEAQIIEFPFVEGKIKLKINDIIYIETAKHKNIFYTQEGCYSIYKKLDEIEDELRGVWLCQSTFEFSDQHALYQKNQQLCHDVDNGKRNIRAKDAICRGEKAIYLV